MNELDELKDIFGRLFPKIPRERLTPLLMFFLLANPLTMIGLLLELGESEK